MYSGLRDLRVVNVAFMGNYSKEWMGGVNYLSNLLYAISLLKDKKIKPIVFLGNKTDKYIIQKFEPYAQIVQDSLFDRISLKWFTSKVMEKIFAATTLKTKLLNRYEISVLSHSDITKGFDAFTIINWIPDFQHVHLPDLFSYQNSKGRNVKFMNFFRESQSIIVSSNDAYHDASIFAPDFIQKVKVLQFVSQPNKEVFNLGESHLESLANQYEFKGKFFYLPNQFWKHKNHAIVFEAVKLLKDQGIEILILCTGHMEDYRNPEYIQTLQDYLKQYELQDNIKMLGLVDYQDVLFFIRYSIAVINPSLFEGWSSTVEECKSIGKNMILSNIPIHKEQNPPESFYFNPYDAEELSLVLKKSYLNDSKIPNKMLESYARESLTERTLDFARAYQRIVLDSVNGEK